ncbi:hypothetical protein THS27_03780 [Thalassospira sp. MCCC 1A01428]|nr:hypothetical protein THS27_03780 [Thalassospira sp. MCCC 1A01428]
MPIDGEGGAPHRPCVADRYEYAGKMGREIYRQKAISRHFQPKAATFQTIEKYVILAKKTGWVRGTHPVGGQMVLGRPISNTEITVGVNTIRGVVFRFRWLVREGTAPVHRVR